MKQVRSTPSRLLRLLALTAWLGAGMAHASDYAEITQLLKSGKAAEALGKADQRLTAAPRDPQLRFLRGVAQTDLGQTDAAITTFTQLIQEYPELPEPYNNLAVIYASQNQLDKARTALEMAVRNNPSYAAAHENLGDIYARLAYQAYAKAQQMEANNPTVKLKQAQLRELFQPAAARAAAKPAASRP
ncbi:tetratricopeptide repeat protein [Acidovorax soli]|uniref:tetratricopeptide repeat protein n=1 Tax=Acidovorax soli TaxID=592050 RepID=UPI003D6D371D